MIGGFFSFGLIWCPKKVSGEAISTRACNVNEAPVRIVLPFKDQRSANSARRQLGELGRKIISTRACNVNEAPVRIVLPFKDQRSANSARRQLGELGRKIGIDIHAVYTSRKIGHQIKPKLTVCSKLV